MKIRRGSHRTPRWRLVSGILLGETEKRINDLRFSLYRNNLATSNAIVRNERLGKFLDIVRLD